MRASFSSRTKDVVVDVAAPIFRAKADTMIPPPGHSHTRRRVYDYNDGPRSLLWHHRLRFHAISNLLNGRPWRECGLSQLAYAFKATVERGKQVTTGSHVYRFHCPIRGVSCQAIV